MSAQPRKRIAVMATGGGTNLQAILDYFAAQGDARAADVVLVASDRPQAGALERARAAGIDAVWLREARDPASTEMRDLLRDRQIDLIALAGYLKLVPTSVVEEWAGRIVNVHPALLPAHGGPGMYGLRVHQAVLDARETVSGPTVHFVTHEYDSGPVIAQWPVQVLPTDDAHSLAARVLEAEHALYPVVLDIIARGREDLLPITPDAVTPGNVPAADGIRQWLADRTADRFFP